MRPSQRNGANEQDTTSVDEVGGKRKFTRSASGFFFPRAEWNTDGVFVGHRVDAGFFKTRKRSLERGFVSSADSNYPQTDRGSLDNF
jgi:hypothetical protein